MMTTVSESHELLLHEATPTNTDHTLLLRMNTSESPDTKRQKTTAPIMSDSNNNSSGEGKSVLVTGGAGFIGTHVCVDLLEQGYNVVVVDNLVNSSAMSLDRVQKIVGLSDEDRKKRLILHEVDICDETALRKVFESSPTFQACIHFAGLKVI